MRPHRGIAGAAARTGAVRRLSVSALGIFSFFLIWHVAAASGLVDRIMLPSPVEVFHSASAIYETGELAQHVQASLLRMGAGYALGSALGIALGVVLGRIAFMEWFVGPVLQMARAIPPLALVPLIIFWFGINEGAKVFLITWATFFPVWINTLLGVKGVNPLFVRAGQSLGAKRGILLLRVVIPAALAPIFSGLRVALSISFTVLVAAELAGAIAGLGYFIQNSALSFRVDNIFVGIVVLAILGFIADSLFMVLLYWLFPWYRAQQSGK